MSTDSVIAYDNLSRAVTLLEKSFDRLARSNYYNRSQYPDILLAVEEGIGKVHAWLKYYRKYDQLGGFYMLLAPFVEELGTIISQLWSICKPVRGKRKQSKEEKKRQANRLDKALDSMLIRINTFLDGMQNEDGLIAAELDKGLAEFFCNNIVQPFRERLKGCESQRGSKTYIFPCKDIEHYLSLVNDADRFYSEVVDKLCQHRYKTGHKPSCKGSNKYRLCGFRGNPRKTIMPGGKRLSGICGGYQV